MKRLKCTLLLVITFGWFMFVILWSSLRMHLYPVVRESTKGLSATSPAVRNVDNLNDVFVIDNLIVGAFPTKKEPRHTSRSAASSTVRNVDAVSDLSVDNSFGALHTKQGPSATSLTVRTVNNARDVSVDYNSDGTFSTKRGPRHTSPSSTPSTVRTEHVDNVTDMSVDDNSDGAFPTKEKPRYATVTDANFMSDLFLKNNEDGVFPKEGPCHYFGLRKIKSDSLAEPTVNRTGCTPRTLPDSSCVKANSIYGGPGSDREQPCGGTRQPDICRFTKKEGSDYKVECDKSVCGSTAVQIASIDPELGKISSWSPVEIEDNEKVAKKLQEVADNGHDFVFMRCGNNRQTERALIFPPKLKKRKDKSSVEKLNINIVLLDSISRFHFYRVLPKTVKAMRDIVYDKTIPSTVLDFEMFQSIGQSTFDNIRPLFSGVHTGDESFSQNVVKSLNPLGIEILFGEYHKHDYQTMFQEDLCWYDYWGIMLTDLERLEVPKVDSVFRTRWRNFKAKLKKYHTDLLGLTLFSCDVLKKSGYTNPYDKNKICFNGKYYSQYYIDYTASLYRQLSDSYLTTAPIISYTHINVGHNYHGKAIGNVDSIIASFVNEMAQNHNTLTLLLADHGHKTTSYSRTVDGRFELFSPALFMILPHRAAQLLGKERTAALVTNQKRLLSTFDLHRALITLNDPEKKSSVDYKVSGVFAPIPKSRTCAHIPLLPLTRCRCTGFDQPAADNSPHYKWLAEMALGKMNNEIQGQYLKGQAYSINTLGYGNCMRFTGKSFVDIMERQDGSLAIVSFSIRVVPPVGLTEDEIFKVAIKHPITPREDGIGVEVLTFNRQSIYNKFTSCADSTVDLKLCACVKGQNKSVVESKERMEQLVSRQMFGAKSQLKDLHSGCLFLILRKHDKMTIAYEAANVCHDKTFRLSVNAKTRKMLMTRAMPFTVVLKPRTVMFLISAIRYVLNDAHFDISTNVQVVR